MRITPVTYRNNSTFVVSFTHNIELSNALLDQFADFSGIQLHAPVPLRLQDVCKGAQDDRVRCHQ